MTVEHEGDDQESPVVGGVIDIPDQHESEFTTDPAILLEELAERDRIIRHMGVAAATMGAENARLHDALREEHMKRVAAEEERDRLLEEAMYDAKTTLRSERALRERLAATDEAITQSQAGEQRSKPLRFTVLFLDFDGFNTINSIVGEKRADRLLGKLGSNLRDSVRPIDLACRFGGDEAAVFMPDIYVYRTADIEALRSRLDAAAKAAMNEFMHELYVEGQHALVDELRKIVLTGYSVGVASYSSRRHSTADEVLVEATMFMHRDKRKRRLAAGLNPAAKNVIPEE